MGDRAAVTAGRARAWAEGSARSASARSPGAGGWRLSTARWAIRLALPAAIGLWLLSLRRVNLRGMSDLGLLQVLPVLFWVALGLLTLGFCLALGDRRAGNGWFLAYVLGLIGMVHATPSLLYPELRYAWAWKHVAVVDAMLRHNGHVPYAPEFDIYDQWPGFLQLNVLFLHATSLESPLGYAEWAQPSFNVALLGPLLLIYRSVTRDRRLIWGGVWVYYSCSWVAQDYFAPQAFAFLMFMTVIALVLRQLPTSALPHPGPGERSWPPGRLIAVFAMVAVIASSHQLTPVMLITVLAALSVPRRNRRVTVPVLVGTVAITVAWDSTVARPYLAENITGMLRELINPEANVTSGLYRVGTAAPAQVFIAWVDRTQTGVVLLLAAIAFVCVRWTRRTGLALLAFSPFLLLAANAYGGEMIFRAYLFALPAAAFLVATLIFGRGKRLRLRTLAVYPLLLVMLGSLVFAYYGKEAMNQFTSQEVAACRYAVATAPPGSQFVSLGGAVPGLDMHYDQHYRTQRINLQGSFKDQRQARDLRSALLEVVESNATAPTFVILNKASLADNYLNGLFPAETISRLRAVLPKMPRFTLVYRNDDAVVYRYDPPLDRGL
ncbi:glycosyltransferase [Streptomyces sp. NPDC006365]|uniref:glycosyltransferase n=1 Tax=Streptomyces sp. NPDC006365 TaxID=3364744 RepID=UPI00369A651E